MEFIQARAALGAHLTLGNSPLLVQSHGKLLPVEILLQFKILARTDTIRVAQFVEAFALRQYSGKGQITTACWQRPRATLADFSIG
jgi:hypothetical protein